MGWLHRDGVKLSYEDEGKGDPPLLMVHGWCCDRTHFDLQAERFRREHRVVSVDLRGHGRSDKPRQVYTMEGFADDLAWLCERLVLQRPVVIGHSMGGIVAFDLAARYSNLLSAIVMLDAAVVLPDGARAAIPAMVERLRGPDYRDVLRDYVASALFLASDRAETCARILEGMASTPQHVMVSALEGLRAYDPTAVAGGLTAPALYVAADEPQPRADMVRFHELCPQLSFGQTVGSGHFCQLEVPEQINPMIERFLAVTFARDA